MGTVPQPVLDPEDLNDTDASILDLLRDGRVTPPLVSERLGISREYASERLIRLREHDHATRPAPGLYELVDDPRGGAVEIRRDGEVEHVVWGPDVVAEEIKRHREELHDCRERVIATQQALDDVEAAAERGGEEALRDALERARDVVEDGG